MFSVATEDSENGSSLVCNASVPELVKNPDIFESSSGLEPMGLDHSSKEGDSVNSVKEPEITELKEASGRSVSSEFWEVKTRLVYIKFFLLCMTTRGHIDTTSKMIVSLICSTVLVHVSRSRYIRGTANMILLEQTFFI